VNRVVRTVTAIVLAAIFAVAVTVVATPWWDRMAKTTYVANFANSNGLFVGDEVRILGVAVGTVDKIEPQATDSKVTFSVDSRYPVPADAKAAILAPSLITARAVQLVPAYSGGPKLPAGSTIPLQRTAVPVEFDDFRRQLEKLTESLQPTTPGGVNTLGDFIDSTAANLRGQGETARDTIIKLSQAISALGDHSSDIYSTIRNLQLLVSALYSSSELLASFNRTFATTTTLLTNTPNEVADAVQGLDRALSDLRGFVAENREGLGVTLDRLSSITTALNDSREDIKQVGHVGPSVFQNFVNIYQPAQGGLTGILALNNFSDTISFVCGTIESASRRGADYSSRLCEQYLAPIVKNRQYNFLPIGGNPFVGSQARPNEITYSEDWLNPNLPPPAAAAQNPGPGAAAPLPAEAPLPADAPLPAEAPAPAAAATDPGLGLQGLMVPGQASEPGGGTP
jgi:phospholipid/cholesterol/gamma-HCH transport system substrate-binding protein